MLTATLHRLRRMRNETRPSRPFQAMLTATLHRLRRSATPASGAPATRRSEAGSGTAIGVTVLFPALMLVIIAIFTMSETARVEQAVQGAANRAARIASLCCHYTEDAEAAAEASLTAATGATALNRIRCNNDFVADSEVGFVDVGGNVVVDTASPDPVPPGGTVYVSVRCRVLPLFLGGFGFLGLDIERHTLGVATIDPYRERQGS